MQRLAYRVPEVAASLACSERKVYWLIADGQLEAAHVTDDKSVRVLVESLREFLEARRSQVIPPDPDGARPP